MNRPFILQIVGYKNSGKTQLICKLIEKCVQAGLRVGSIKHDMHAFEMDHVGRDTWLHRQAGAEQIAITSPQQTAILFEKSYELDDLIAQMSNLDIVLVEGFKQADYPKFVMWNKPSDDPYLLTLMNIKAVIMSFPGKYEGKDRFHRDDISSIWSYLQRMIKGDIE